MFRVTSCYLTVLILTFAGASFSASAQSIDNGSLTGPIANAGVPPGWVTLLQSPDTNDPNNPAGINDPGVITWTVAPSGFSPDGGTWVGFAAITPEFRERFGQTVTGLTIGEEYELSWYAGNFGAIQGGEGGETFTEANAVEVFLDNVSIGDGGSLPVAADWISQSLTFVATAASHEISFGPLNMVDSYLQIDGISLTLSSAPPPPTPATSKPIPTLAEWSLITLILMLGFMGMVAARRAR
jgi:hypothetical protein